MKRFLLTISFLTALLLPARAIVYSVTDLGVNPSGTSSTAGGISSNGTYVAGSADIGGFTSDAALWTNGSYSNAGSLTNLHLTFGYGVNSSGDVVGSTRKPGQNNVAFLYTGGVMYDMGTLGGDFGEANGINDSGVVVGTSSLVVNGGGSPYRAFSYTVGGGMVNLGTLAGGSDSRGNAINSSGVIVGDSMTGSGDQYAFIYSGGVMTGLGLIPGGNNFTTATAISSNGLVTGYGYDSNWYYHSFYYDGVTMVDITPSLSDDVLAYGINASGYIVGRAYDGGQHAFVYDTSTSTKFDLNTLLDSSGAGWNLRNASAINDLGQIVGSGIIGGQTHGFLLTPIPEPASIVSLLGGLGLLGIVLKRRRTA